MVGNFSRMITNLFFWLFGKNLVTLQHGNEQIMIENVRRYPVGIQTFEKIIDGGYVYIDKTDLMWQLTQQSSYVFLSRPRRFGKSLLSSTLKSYFEGRRDLFEGLRI